MSDSPLAKTYHWVMHDLSITLPQFRTFLCHAAKQELEKFELTFTLRGGFFALERRLRKPSTSSVPSSGSCNALTTVLIVFVAIGLNLQHMGLITIHVEKVMEGAAL